jgi:hypothetical protein
MEILKIVKSKDPSAVGNHCSRTSIICTVEIIEPNDLTLALQYVCSSDKPEQ